MSDGLPLAEARAHLRLGSRVPDTDVEPLIAAAEGRISAFLGRELVGDDGWPSAAEVPPLVAHAVKLALSDFYVNREAPQLTDDQLRPMIGRHQRMALG